jgi:hypothetical protein
MTQLTAAERLAKVKTALGISGDYQDETLTFYIEEVIEELVDAGVARLLAECDAAVGCIALGVNDLWNYSSGGVKHSDYFYKRLIQLSMKSVEEPIEILFTLGAKHTALSGMTFAEWVVSKYNDNLPLPIIIDDGGYVYMEGAGVRWGLNGVAAKETDVIVAGAVYEVIPPAN